MNDDRPIDRSATDFTKLLTFLLSLPQGSEDVRRISGKPSGAVCMNPNKPCEACIFQTSEWCPPHERAAKGKRR